MQDWIALYRRFAVGAVCLATVFAGFAAGSVDPLLRVLPYFAVAWAIWVWCALDAKIHGKQFLQSFAWLMMFLWPIGILAYFVWTRRWRGLLAYALSVPFWLIVHAFGSFLRELLE